MPPQKMSPPEFRDFVLSVLEAEFPESDFTVDDDPHLLRSGEAEFGLQNLYARYEQSEVSYDELHDLVKEHFSRVLSALSVRGSMEELTWDEVQERVKLQLMPADYADQVPVVQFPFLDELRVSVIVDSPTAYSYVRTDDVGRWDVLLTDLYETAATNLAESSSEIEISQVEAPEALMAIETKDGFDAARILLPRLRRFAAEQLGDPFFAGIPNRDFLIMWSAGNSAEFQQFVREKLIDDHAKQPYPLTSRVLIVSTESIRYEG